MQTEALNSKIDKTDAICDWVKRTYETTQSWSEKAISVYLQADGDSVLARTILATELRSHFISEKPQTEIVDRWNKGHTEIEQVKVIPPKVVESDAAYVDWLAVADYLLVTCAAEDEIDNANATRRGMYRTLQQSHKLRSLVVDAVALIEASPDISDEHALKKLQEADREDSLASMVTVKKARQWIKSGEKPPKSIEPEPPKEIELYSSIYF